MPKRHATARQTTDSNTYRFFVDPQTINGMDVRLVDPALVHQLVTVLRLQPSQVVTLLDNSSMAYQVVLDHLTKHGVDGTVIDQTLVLSEPHTQLALYVALMRGERWEWVLQKGTELGVSVFVPVASERSVVTDQHAVDAGKFERWRRIIREAAEQSRRGHLPELRPVMTLADACRDAVGASQAVLLWEGSGGRPLRTLISTSNMSSAWSVFSGPEGGWSPAEVAQATDAGLQLATLGPRTLRAETAPLVAAAALLFAAGDLD